MSSNTVKVYIIWITQNKKERLANQEMHDEIIECIESFSDEDDDVGPGEEYSCASYEKVEVLAPFPSNVKNWSWIRYIVYFDVTEKEEKEFEDCLRGFYTNKVIDEWHKFECLETTLQNKQDLAL